MSNWFEENQTKSILVYTIFVAISVSGCTYYLLDERKVKYMIAKIQEKDAIIERLRESNNSLETRKSELLEENSRFKNWLMSSDTSFPALESTIKNLESDLEKANKVTHLGCFSGDGSDQLDYRSIVIILGQSFVDPITGLTIGVSKINFNHTVNLTLSLPDKKKVMPKGVLPGESWDFSYIGKEYRLAVSKVDWIGGNIEISILENQTIKKII